MLEPFWGQEEEALEAVKMCVELGNDVNAVNDLMETALHGAAFRGANIVVDYLVEHGAKLDAREANGWIPWGIANGFSYTAFYKAKKHTAELLARYMAGAWHVDGGRGDSRRGLFRVLADPARSGPGRARSRRADGGRLRRPLFARGQVAA